MSFWSLYDKACKPGDSEEALDRLLFRPLAYPVARALLPVAFVTPTAVTVASIVLGVLATAALWIEFPFHMQIAAAGMIATNVLDCADGMLARMRGTSSALGRMIDGVADMTWTVLFSGATLALAIREHDDPWWLGALVAVLGAIAFVTSAIQLAMFDIQRNRWLRFTRAEFREDDGEAHERALARYREARRRGLSPFAWIAWRLYLTFTGGQERAIRSFDPEHLPYRPFDPRLAALYRKHYRAPWRLFRWCFGSTSLAFGLALVGALELPLAYLVFRVAIVNALFYGVAGPLMRRATRNLRADLAAGDAEPAV